MTAKILTVAQQKGGAGKTTLAAHLAVAFAKSGKKVAVVDIDPQRSLSDWHRRRGERLGDAGILLSQVQGWRARAEVEKLARDHDLVVVDSPPHAETEAKIAVRAADLVIVPLQPSPMDVWATRPTLELAEQEKSPTLLVLTRVPPRANLTEEMMIEVQRYGAKVAKARLGNRVAFAGTLAEGRAVGELGAKNRAAQEIDALAKEILKLAG